MKERLFEVFHYKRNVKALEKTKVRPVEQPLIEGNLPDLFEVFPSPFNAGEIIRRQRGK